METQKIKTSDGQELKIITKSETSKDVSVENIPGISIDQLNIGQEVKRQVEIRGDFDTSDASLTRVNNIYNLYVADPENELISFLIDDINCIFQVGNFGGNPALAYSTLETQLQDSLGDMYTVEYTSAGNYTIVKEFEKPIEFFQTSLIRNIQLNGFTEDGIIDIIIDGNTITLDGSVFSGSATSALSFLISELPDNTYYTKQSGSTLDIVRIDGFNINISQTNTTRYTYNVTSASGEAYRSSSQVYSYDSVFGMGGSGQPSILNNKVNFDGTEYIYSYPTSSTSEVDFTWFYNNGEEIYDGFTDGSGDFVNTNKTVSFSKLLDIVYAGLGVGYIKGAMTLSFFGLQDAVISFPVRKTDYSQIPFSNTKVTFIYSDGTTFQESSIANINEIQGVGNTAPYTLSETVHNPVIVDTPYNQITTTFTRSSNNFFIRVDILPVSVEIGAYSSVGTSTGRYEKGEQKTTPGDGSSVVEGKIFQTDASNYGTIIKLVKGGFIINFDTTVSNIINYTCR